MQWHKDIHRISMCCFVICECYILSVMEYTVEKLLQYKDNLIQDRCMEISYKKSKSNVISQRVSLVQWPECSTQGSCTQFVRRNRSDSYIFIIYVNLVLLSLVLLKYKSTSRNTCSTKYASYSHPKVSCSDYHNEFTFINCFTSTFSRARVAQ